MRFKMNEQLKPYIKDVNRSKYFVSWKSFLTEGGWKDSTSRTPAIGTYCSGCKSLHGAI